MMLGSFLGSWRWAIWPLAFGLPFVACDGGEGGLQRNESIKIPDPFAPESYRTELDRELAPKVSQLRESLLGRSLLTPYFDNWKDVQASQEANLTMLRIGESQLRWVHELIQAAAVAMGVPAPESFVVQDSRPLVYLKGVENPILVIHSEVFSVLEPEELLFVIGQQLGHLRLDHLLPREVMQAVFAVTDAVPTETLRTLLAEAWMLSAFEWVREAEVSADRLGLLLVGDSELAARSLVKLASGFDPEIMGELDMDSFIRQREEVEVDAFVLRKIPVLLREARSEHPYLGERVQALRDFSTDPLFIDRCLAGCREISLKPVVEAIRNSAPPGR